MRSPACSAGSCHSTAHRPRVARGSLAAPSRQSRATSWRTVQGPVSVRSWIRVEADGTSALVSGGADGGFTGPLGRLLTRLAVPAMVRQAQFDLQTLREHLESAPRA
jgi:hypothetical protein